MSRSIHLPEIGGLHFGWGNKGDVHRVGETEASCYGGRLLQGHFMQNYYIDGEIADSSFILIHQGNH